MEPKGKGRRLHSASETRLFDQWSFLRHSRQQREQRVVLGGAPSNDSGAHAYTNLLNEMR